MSAGSEHTDDRPIAPFPLDWGRVGDGGVSTQAEVKARVARTPSKPQPRTKGTPQFEHPDHASGAVKRSRALRSNMSFPEKKLWKALRRLSAHIKRQAPIGPYIVDFVSHRKKVIIEVDGAYWHSLPGRTERDEKRTTWLEGQGYRVLRFGESALTPDIGVVVRLVAAALGIEMAPAPNGALLPDIGGHTSIPDPSPIEGEGSSSPQPQDPIVTHQSQRLAK